MKNIIRVLLAILVLNMVSCTNTSETTSKLTEAYLADYDSIIAYREGAGRAHYLQLVALFPISPFEIYSIGSDQSSDLLLEIPEVPGTIGTLFSTPDSTIFTAAEGTIVTTSDGDTIQSKALEFDQYDNSEKLHSGRIEFIVKAFQDKRFIRVWDLENPRVAAFPGYEWYDLNPDFILTAEYEPLKTPIVVTVPTSMGVQDRVSFTGKVTFEYQGEKYELLSEGGGFLMFGDETTGVETYGSGRYLYFELPKDGEKEVMVDFNVSYNPPCSYSDVTTCRFPPKQNYLPFEVLAGEKYHH